MSDRPTIFLSSTMQALKDLRSVIEQRLKRIGYDVVIVEANAIVEHGASIKQTCLQNVDRADILVLVLNGQYGRPVDGEWLVKSEFYHAKKKGKPTYVFVDADTSHSFDLASQNPKVVPGRYRIHKEVFAFLQELQTSWLFKFTDAEDLAKTLRAKLAEYFAQLLRMRSQASLIRLAHLLEKMNSLYRAGNYVQTILSCEEILRIDPESADALLARAVSRIRLHGLDNTQSVDAGIHDCKKVLRCDPSNYRARYNLANFKLLSPRYLPRDVRRDLRKLFREFPEYEYYFKSDTEFCRMLLLRESWLKRSRAQQ